MLKVNAVCSLIRTQYITSFRLCIVVIAARVLYIFFELWRAEEVRVELTMNNCCLYLILDKDTPSIITPPKREGTRNRT
jgi:hypothetical protein